MLTNIVVTTIILLLLLSYCEYERLLLLMDKILHDPKDPKLWELWYIPYDGSCRILSINSSTVGVWGIGACHGNVQKVPSPTVMKEAHGWLSKLGSLFGFLI